MEEVPGALKRSRTLTNSAAEWVETRAGPALGIQQGGEVSLTDEQYPEFAVEADSFVDRDEVPDEFALDAESAARIEQFKSLMRQLCDHLKRKKVRTLNVELKEPEAYNFEDVLAIARSLQETKNASNSVIFLRSMRSCFRATSKDKTALMNVMKLIPGDAYGSLISGGFTLIIAGIATHEEKRNAIEKALLGVLAQLERVQRLNDVHLKPKSLRAGANAVCIAVLAVLEKIIDYQTMNLGQKMLSKVKGRGTDIEEALHALGECISDFRDEVDLCSQWRFGREQEVLVQYLRGDLQTAEQLRQATMLNSIYRFISAHPNFIPVDGTMQPLQIPGRDGAETASIRSVSSDHLANQPDPYPDPGPVLIKRFTEALSPFNADPKQDITECFENRDIVPQAERDRANFILKSEKLMEWQTKRTSCVLIVDAETSPDDGMNGITLTTAMLREALAQASSVPVLAFFCGLRTIHAVDKRAEAGPLALLNSINAQLLQFLVHHRQADLDILSDSKSLTKSISKIGYAIKLLKDLLRKLPSKDMVYILIDCFSSISGDDEINKRLMGVLMDLAVDPAVEEADIAVKVLVTDPLPNSICYEREHLHVHVLENDVDDSDEADSSLLEDLAQTRVSRPNADESSDESDDDAW